jgi:hypothetical protein
MSGADEAAGGYLLAAIFFWSTRSYASKTMA